MDGQRPEGVNLAQLLERTAAVSDGSIQFNHASAAQPWGSVYPSSADAARAADRWTELTGQTVAAADRQAGHLKLHPHGPGGPHPLPGGIGHSGFQVDATRELHLLTLGRRVAAGPTPFQIGLPGGERVTVMLPPGACWVMCRLSDGQVAVPLELAPGLSLYQRRPKHGVPPLEGVDTFLTQMVEFEVKAESMEKAVEIAARSLSTALQQVASSTGRLELLGCVEPCRQLLLCYAAGCAAVVLLLLLPTRLID